MAEDFVNIKNLDSQYNSSVEELIAKVREHKHNYAEDFGLAVSVPAQAVFDELISHPDSFSIEEKEKIVTAFTTSIECKSLYEGLGLPIHIQLNRLKKRIIPQIKENATFYSALLKSHESFNDRWVLSKLRMALSETESICSKLENIEHFDYGKSEPFSLSSEIRSTFNKENGILGTSGKKLIQIDIDSNFGRFSDIKVNMNQESFRSHFLGNIIKNLHDHAFNGFDVPLGKNIKATKQTEKWIKSHRWLMVIPGFGTMLLPILLSREIKRLETKEKKVRILFKQEENIPDMLIVTIENNGNPFTGNIDTVFEMGIGDNGEGHGIGLYSAKKFIESYGGSIKMFTNANKEYVVGFNIQIPIIND